MLDVICLLPDEHNINAVIDADRQNQTKREYIQQVEINMQQFHRSDHRSDPERQRYNLD